jgi:hypothetical protein
VGVAGERLNMSPANIGLAITEQSSLIGQLCVIGGRRP